MKFLMGCTEPGTGTEPEKRCADTCGPFIPEKKMSFVSKNRAKITYKLSLSHLNWSILTLTKVGQNNGFGQSVWRNKKKISGVGGMGGGGPRRPR